MVFWGAKMLFQKNTRGKYIFSFQNKENTRVSLQFGQTVYCNQIRHSSSLHGVVCMPYARKWREKNGVLGFHSTTAMSNRPLQFYSQNNLQIHNADVQNQGYRCGFPLRGVRLPARLHGKSHRISSKRMKILYFGFFFFGIHCLRLKEVSLNTSSEGAMNGGN